jgi:choline dehydrogenase-like flavoprotein
VLPAGVGNARGMVGRFLMDHPRLTVGTFAPEDAPAVQAMLGLKHTAAGARVQCGFALSTEVQYRERLLNAVAWTTQHVAEDDVWLSIRKMTLAQSVRQERLDAARRVFRGSNQILPGLWNRFARRNSLPRHYDKLALDVMVEQMPDADSRLRLSARKDALGVPLSEIHWKVSEVERRTVLRLAHAVNDSLQRAGFPTASMAEWVRRHRWEDAVFIDAAHPAGTTRMASRESEGVVDSNCRVFGMENLYIAGSSVFPTGGHANPTLTIVALALRLADTLRVLPKSAIEPARAEPVRRALSFAFRSQRSATQPTTGLSR